MRIANGPIGYSLTNSLILYFLPLALMSFSFASLIVIASGESFSFPSLSRNHFEVFIFWPNFSSFASKPTKVRKPPQKTSVSRVKELFSVDFFLFVKCLMLLWRWCRLHVNRLWAAGLRCWVNIKALVCRQKAYFHYFRQDFCRVSHMFSRSNAWSALHRSLRWCALFRAFAVYFSLWKALKWPFHWHNCASLSLKLSFLTFVLDEFTFWIYYPFAYCLWDLQGTRRKFRWWQSMLETR